MNVTTKLFRPLFKLLITSSLVSGCAHSADATSQPSMQTEGATGVLHDYEVALNQADVDRIVALYAEDGVFMAQHRGPAQGREEIQQAYEDIFGVIRLDIAFDVDEVVVVSRTVAYARTRSVGTTTIVADGATVSEANQELFILVRESESDPWRIGRYIFSTTNPPRG